MALHKGSFFVMESQNEYNEIDNKLNEEGGILTKNDQNPK